MSGDCGVRWQVCYGGCGDIIFVECMVLGVCWSVEMVGAMLLILCMRVLFVLCCVFFLQVCVDMCGIPVEVSSGVVFLCR